MGSNTKAKITGNPTIDEAASYLNSLKEVNEVKVDLRSRAHKAGDTMPDGRKADHDQNAMGYLDVTFTRENGAKARKSIFFIEKYKDSSEMSCTAPFLPEEHLYLDFDLSESSVELAELVANNFGGFIIPDDCSGDEDGFFHEISGKGSYAMPEAERRMLDMLGGLKGDDKYKLLRLVRENKEVIKGYLEMAEA